MCRFFLPAFQARFCCCLSKMKRAPESKAATESEPDEDEPKKDEQPAQQTNDVKVKEPTGRRFNPEIDKPKITFQEHDPPTQPLPALSGHLAGHPPAPPPDCIQCAQCSCVQRSTSVGQINAGGVGQVGNGLEPSSQARNQLISRPSTAASFLQQRSSLLGSSTRASSSSSDSSAEATPKGPKEPAYLHAHHHCPHHRLTTETATHQLSNASPLLSFPKAISHNDATLFTRQNTIGLPTNPSGLEVRRLSDSAALNSSANKPATGPSSFMPTRRCVLRLDGCSYLIGKRAKTPVSFSNF